MGIRKFFHKERAIIKSDNGITLYEKNIKPDKDTFSIGDKTYNIQRDNIYRDEMRGLFIHTHRYFYNINNPNPLSFNKTSGSFEPVINPKLYTKVLECEVLIKLNTVNTSFFSKLNIPLVVGALCILALIGYVVSIGLPK